MRVREDPLERVGVGGVLAPHLREAEEEALLGRVAVDDGAVLALQGVHQRHERDPHAAVVADVLAERELAVEDAGLPVFGSLTGE